ncbi:MAG: alkaline phosphatase family protein [Candidatus Latescibacteria bacterium]|nr:alkaline phosphatase family protein [Candidatus Latescibacterota bacterium]
MIGRSLLAALVVALASCREPAPPAPRLFVLGIDGMDPQILAHLIDAGRLPNFARLARQGGMAPLETSIPPQSPVAWSNFITGTGPEGHGLFDFVHRDAATRMPFLSTSKADASGEHMELLRRGVPFWDLLGNAGIPTTIFKVPANFPPSPAPDPHGCNCFMAFAGMGTPDLLGTYGTFVYYTDGPYRVPAHLTQGGAELAPGGQLEVSGGQVVSVQPQNGEAHLSIAGPQVGDHQYQSSFDLVVDRDHEVAQIQLGGQQVVVRAGEWTPWLEVDYGRRPLSTEHLTGICRFYLKATKPHLQLYLSPVNLDPEHPAMPLSTPAEAVNELARAEGRHFTLGIPDESKALEAAVFDYADYLSQHRLALGERRAHLRHFLADFRQGFVFFYVGSLDQLCHVLWRTSEPHHPGYRPEFAPYHLAIEDEYAAMDTLLGEVVESLGRETRLIVLSDHGFAPYEYSFNLNTWLQREGYLALRPGADSTPLEIIKSNQVDWKKTRAYGLGLNGLYLNLWGREQGGMVEPEDRQQVLAELAARLLQVRDPLTQQPVIRKVYRTEEARVQFPDLAPDLIVGYARGYRVSGESAVGQLTPAVIDPNMAAWSGDHCIAAEEVPGVLLSNQPLRQGEFELRDVPVSILGFYGLPPGVAMKGKSIW